MTKIKLHIITLFVLGLAFSAKANFDMTQEELVKKLGSVAETRASWAGDQFADLHFFLRLPGQMKLHITATMKDGHCHQLVYCKSVDPGYDTPLTGTECQTWMNSCLPDAKAAWKQIEPKKWQLEKGPGVPIALTAKRLADNTFVIYDEEIAALPTKTLP